VNKPILCAIAAACITLAAVGAHAQRAVQDRTANEAITLFQHSCLPFAGMPAGLRDWAVRKNFVTVPAATAVAFLGGEPGQAYWASTPDVKMVLVSNDTGACRILMAHADKPNVDQALQDYFVSIGSPATKVYDKASPDGETHQSLFTAAFRDRTWLVSTTTHSKTDAPGEKPMLIILTTSRARGGPHP
jgi:hypothetical protein